MYKFGRKSVESPSISLNICQKDSFCAGLSVLESKHKEIVNLGPLRMAKIWAIDALESKGLSTKNHSGASNLCDCYSLQKAAFEGSLSKGHETTLKQYNKFMNTQVVFAYFTTFWRNVLFWHRDGIYDLPLRITTVDTIIAKESDFKNCKLTA